jgi:Protein of unknown function (DUF2726)
MSSYRIQESLLGPAERSFHQALTLIVCQRGLIFPKVKLSQLFATVPSTEGTADPLSGTPLHHQEVDFLICERFTTQPLLAVYLQASNATSTTDSQQQAFAICAEAGLPVLKIEQRAAYRMDELLAAIEPYLQGNQVINDFRNGDRMQTEQRPAAVNPTRKSVVIGKPAICPRCGIPLTAKMMSTYYQGRLGEACRCQTLN